MNRIIWSGPQVALLFNKIHSYRLSAHIDQEVKWLKNMVDNLKPGSFGTELSLPFLTEWLHREVNILTQHSEDPPRRSVLMEQTLNELKTVRHFVTQFNSNLLRMESQYEYATGTLTLDKWLAWFEQVDWTKANLDLAIDAGWHDWFCNDNQLIPKLMKMKPLLELFIKSPLVNCPQTYVFFNNNCTFNGKKYDSFSLADIRTQDVIWWITTKDGHTSKCTLLHRNTGFENQNNLLSHPCLLCGKTEEEATKPGINSIKKFLRLNSTLVESVINK